MLWAAEEPDDRASRWRAFAYVRDWRTLQRKIGAGVDVSSEERTKIENALHPYEHLFFTKEARDAKAQGRPLPANPFVRDWHGRTGKDIFDAVEGQVVHSELYRPFSEWHHWDIARFAPLLQFDDHGNGFRMKGHNPALTATGLASAFQCLWQTLKRLDEIVSVGISTELDRLYDKHVAIRR